MVSPYNRQPERRYALFIFDGERRVLWDDYDTEQEALADALLTTPRWDIVDMETEPVPR